MLPMSLESDAGDTTSTFVLKPRLLGSRKRSRPSVDEDTMITSHFWTTTTEEELNDNKQQQEQLDDSILQRKRVCPSTTSNLFVPILMVD